MTKWEVEYGGMVKAATRKEAWTKAREYADENELSVYRIREMEA